MKAPFVHVNSPYAGYRILVADDNLINCQIARRMLENLGCTVDLASSGREVLEKQDKQIYDLILLDCQMPDLDGYEVCRALRQLKQAGAKHTPIIGWTTLAHQDEKEKCASAGMDNFLSKPLRTDELTHLLSAWLTPRTAMSVTPHPEDLGGLESMHRLCGTGFAELAGLFEEDMPERLRDLKNAIQAPDYLAASRIAHLMSGCCASIGAIHLSDLCQQLEMHIRNAQFTDMPARVAAIESAYEHIRLTLRAMLHQAGKAQ